RDGLRAVASAAEAAGFDSIWVMDHLRQIPQVGRDWDPMLESYTTLGWLAAVTSRVRLGAMVTAITIRNVALLGKMVATLDAINIMGDVEQVRRKVAVLGSHAASAARDVTEIDITHLSPTLLGRDRAQVRALVDQLRPRRVDPDRFAAQVNAGTIEDQVGRF